MTAGNIAHRTGRYIQQDHYRAFIPTTLPFSPPLQYDDELVDLLSKADQAMGRLDAAADMLPNPDLFVQMYIRKEALLSSKIEGVTQASLSEVVEQEARRSNRMLPPDVAEVLNYVRAMNYGLEQLTNLPLSNRLMRDIHAHLLENVRGGEKSPGEWRRTQNWIGPANSDLNTAVFVPPPVFEMDLAMADLERYLHDPSPAPILIKAGLAHYQFETIHPFLDGNGRMGRLLVVFYLCERKVLTRPLLYLSAYVNVHKEEYYDRLQAARDNGDLENWIRFFLTAIWKVAQAAAKTAHDILELRETYRARITKEVSNSLIGIRFLDALLASPVIWVSKAADLLGVSFPTANSLVHAFSTLGILREVTGQSRNRLFVFSDYLDLMERGLDIT